MVITILTYRADIGEIETTITGLVLLAPSAIFVQSVPFVLISTFQLRAYFVSS